MGLQKANKADHLVSKQGHKPPVISLKGANKMSPGELSSCIVMSVTNHFLTTEISLNTATFRNNSPRKYVYSEEEETV